MVQKPLIISFDTIESYLGIILVAMTSKGICQVSIDDDIQIQINHLRKNFPSAIIENEKDSLANVLPSVQQFILHPTRNFSIPLDLHGTAFQKLVWRALLEIPPGQTITYTQLAQKIGRPNAGRAVANANGANKIAVLVPCHRVIRKDGSLGGYRWGLERKRILLEREMQQNKN